MPEVANPVLEAGAVVLTLASPSSLLSVKRADGAVVGVLQWDAATGDVYYNAPAIVGGGGARRHIFNDSVRLSVGATSSGPLDVTMDGFYLTATAATVGGVIVQSWVSNLGVRRGYIGYGSVGTPQLQITNELAGGTVLVSTAGVFAIAAAATVHGTDPGGAALVRIGGAVLVGGPFAVTHASNADVNANIANTHANGNGLLSRGGGDAGRYCASFVTWDNVVMKQVDRPTGAGQLAALVYAVDTGALVRLMIDAAGTGPGGVGRRVYAV